MNSNTQEYGRILEFAYQTVKFNTENEYRLGIMRNQLLNEINIYWKENTTNGSATIPCNMNMWNNLVFSVNKSGLWSVYLNNIDQLINITFSPPNRTYNVKVLGRSSYSTTQNLNGSIDDFRIYNKVLSTNEIKILYESKFQTIYNVSIPQGIFSDILLVGGGGSGGSTLGGGGGGGGILYKSQNFLPNNNYIVRVGKGGDKVQREIDKIGNNGIYTDVMGTIVFGGGGGGNYQNIDGSSGGSGGGGGFETSSGGNVIYPQYGNVIINGTYTGTIGESVISGSKSGDGGNSNGVIYTISGTSYRYSKSGIGSINTIDNSRTNTHGINYGYGGGGGGWNSGTYSGDGGDGICIFKYTLKTTNTSNYIITTPDTEKVSSGDLILINGGGIRRVYGTTENYFTLYNDEQTDIGTIPSTAIGFTKLNNLLQFNVSGDIDNSSIYISNIDEYTKITVPFIGIFTIKISAIFNLEFATEFCELHIRLDRSGFNSRYIRTFYLPPISAYEGNDSSTLNCTVDLNLKENDILIFESNYKLSSKLSSYITFTNAGTTVIQGSLIQNIINGSGDSVLTFQSPLVNVDNTVSVDLSQITTNNLTFDTPLVKYNNNVSITTNSFAQYSHKHDASDINTGILNINRIPSLSTLYSTAIDIVNTSNYINNIDNRTSNIEVINNTDININANVGIGTTTPSYKLDVNGDINISSGSTFKINGSTIATTDTVPTTTNVLALLSSQFEVYYGTTYIRLKMSVLNEYAKKSDLNTLSTSVTTLSDSVTLVETTLNTYITNSATALIDYTLLTVPTTNGFLKYDGNDWVVDSTNGGADLNVNGDVNISGTLTTENLTVTGTTTNINTTTYTTENLEITSTNADGPSLKITHDTTSHDIMEIYNSSSVKVFTIDSSDNVGIGAVSANRHETASVLHIDKGGTGSIHNLLTLRGGTSGQNNGGARIYLGGDNDHFSSIFSQHTGNGYTYLAFGTSSANTSPTEKMRIDNDGSVGIGTTSPTHKLDVNGDINIPSGSSFKINGSAIATTDTTYTGGTGITVTGTTINSDITQYVDSNVTTLLNSGITGGLKVTSGNVGIGTTNPNYKLDFGKNGTGGTSSDYGGMLSLYNNEGNYLYGIDADNYGSGYGMNFYVSGGGKAEGNIRMKIDKNTGNVGIGITNPIYKLDVNGSLNCTSLNVNGSAFTGGSDLWSTTSPSTSTSDIFYNDSNTITGLAYSYGSIVTITGAISDHTISSKMGLIVQHTNRSQGLGFGYNGISQCGTNTDENFTLKAKGSGLIRLGTNNSISLQASDTRVGISTTPTYEDAKLSINVADEGTMLSSPDISHFLWRINIVAKWGMYWSTNTSGNNYYINNDANPNQIVFVGDNVSRAAIDLDNGAFWSTDWYYLKGNGGIYWQDHSGGWNMTESTTIKVSGTKHVHCTNNLYVDQKIGIGTTNPQRTLDLTTTGQITFGDNVSTSATNSGIYWHNNTNYGIYRTSEAWSGNYAQLMLKFDTGIILDPGSGSFGKSHVGVVGGMSIGDSYYSTKYDNGIIVQGYVGIGTTTPSTNLDVNGGIKCNSLTVNGISITANGGGGGSSNDGISITNVGSSTNSGSAISANMGISGSTYAYIDLRTNNNNGGWIDFSSVDNVDFKTRIRGYNNPQKLVFTTGGTYNTTIDASGNLQVPGDITAYYSDERLKNKTDSIDNVLSILDNINVFKYENNDLANNLGFKNNKSQIGLSAQEIKKYYPELVELAPFDSEYDIESGENISKSGENYLTLKYDRLVPVLLQGIKELNNKNKLLEIKNNKLENDLELIKNDLESIKKYIS